MLDRAGKIKIASWIGIIGNGLLAIFKIAAGSMDSSLSVVADGIDSAGDVLISLMTLYIASLLIKPPNIKFPYGYGKAEQNATIVLAVIIFFAGAQLAISSISRLIDGTYGEMPGKLAITAIVFSIIIKIILARYQMHIGKKTESSMLLATAKNMQGDIVISCSVLAGIIFTHLFQLPVLDLIFAILVSLWVIWIAIKIFLETNLELMDGNIEKSVYENVFKIVESTPGVRNPHRMRIRRAGHKLMINIDIELDGNMTLSNAHKISHIVEKNIKDGLEHDVFDVVIHVEPYGDKIKEENLGISKEGLKRSKKRNLNDQNTKTK
jgi:cation diffusion facilitator family transporter